MKAILNLLNLECTITISVEKKDNNQKSNLLSDSSQGTHEFNMIQKKELQEDIERINKLFDLANALCDVFMDDKESKINKWAHSKIDDHIKKINNSFLL